ILGRLFHQTKKSGRHEWHEFTLQDCQVPEPTRDKETPSAADQKAGPTPATEKQTKSTDSGTVSSAPPTKDTRRFWRFAPQHGFGYFKRLNNGTWEEIGRNSERMGIWKELRRTPEYVELPDSKRGYRTRLVPGRRGWRAEIRGFSIRPPKE